jgi:hypothetical protein
MTTQKLMTVALFLLPFATMGCMEGTCETDNTCMADDSGATSDDGGSDEPATVTMNAPFNWAPDFSVSGEIVGSGETLEWTTEKPDLYAFAPKGDSILCVTRRLTINDADMGREYTLDWDDEAQCGLAPEGSYDGYNVHTEIRDDNDFDQVWIQFNQWTAPVNNNEAYNTTDEYELTLFIEDDASCIDFVVIIGSSVTPLEGTACR